jgi:hypothetical protein
MMEPEFNPELQSQNPTDWSVHKKEVSESTELFNSKTVITGGTTVDSARTLSVLGGHKTTSKKRKLNEKHKVHKKEQSVLSKAKKAVKDKISQFYHKENTEFTNHFKKDFLNTKPLKKVKATKKFTFIEDCSDVNGQRFSTFPVSYST